MAETNSFSFPSERPLSSHPPSPLRNGNGNGGGYNNSYRNGNGNGNGHNGFANGHPTGNEHGHSNSNGSGIPPVTPPPLYTSRSGSSTPKRSQPSKILGSIDENGGMSPDIPIKSKRRTSPNDTSYNPRAFLNSLFTTTIVPPRNDLDNITGPRGEKFSDVRQNRRSYQDPKPRSRWRRCGWRTFICLALLLVVIATFLAIGLVVGLKRMHNAKNKNSSESDSNFNAPETLTTFPTGTYTFTTYLLSLTTDCTSNPSTWRCYPYTLYADSPTTSIATLTWIISGTNTSDTGPQYTISSSPNPFALPFSNANLTLANKGTQNEYWGFETVMQKVVIPNEAITSDGSAARCYYNQSVVSAKLYTKKQTTLPGNETITASEKPEGAWPGAVEIWQRASGEPGCFQDMDGARVVLQGGGGGGECECEYGDFDVSE
jgi:hypothetical protein